MGKNLQPIVYKDLKLILYRTTGSFFIRLFITRKEDKRVTKQLELAARKLRARSEESYRDDESDQYPYIALERLDRRVADNRR